MSLMIQARFVLLFAVAVCLQHSVIGAEPKDLPAVLDPELTLVPQTLLNLIHTPQVQGEIKLSGEVLREFMPILQEIDGPWWRARIRKPSEQRSITAQQEARLLQALGTRISPAAMKRLKQIELQSQGYRCLLRPEVQAALTLTETQSKDLVQLFQKTDELASKVKDRSGKEDPVAAEAWKAAKSDEPEAINGILLRDQRQALAQFVGTPFDTTKLDRIYPLAPELIGSGKWIGAPVQLKELQGKVLLVHFYAFQCHNCQANFGIYNRWQESLSSKGVQVIGIQTPETSAERNFDSVTEAAKKDDFKFPVLVDLKSENWDAWANTMWPTVHVIDKQGYVRLWWQGELNWQGATGDKTIEQLVERLLNEEIPVATRSDRK